MTADKTMETNGQNQEQGTTRSTGRKTGRKRSSTRGASAKRSRASASRRSTSSRSGAEGQSGRSTSSKRASTATPSRRGRKLVRGAVTAGIASRLLSRGRQAVGEAYDWAAEGGSRAMPLASRLPDQRMVQRFVDERPYMLGALGLGIGAMIGLMLPSPLSMRGGGTTSRGRSRSRQ